MTDLERNEVKSLIYEVLTKVAKSDVSVMSNEESTSFWKTVKIKELPVKESIDKQSVLLIEDNEDTKQMNISILYKAIEDAADQMLEMIRSKLVAVDSFMAEMKKKDEEFTANEEERKKNEKLYTRLGTVLGLTIVIILC